MTEMTKIINECSENVLSVAKDLGAASQHENNDE